MIIGKQYLEEKRTIYTLNNHGVDMKLHFTGLFIFIIIFVIIIPYFLIKHKAWTLAAAYFPNLDLLGTCIGYHGGPGDLDIWKYLYNPNVVTLAGYHTATFINLLSLLAVTYIIAHYALKSKDIYKGWSKAFIILPITYFVPNNIIVVFMNKLGKTLNYMKLKNNLLHYLLVVGAGLLLTLVFIILEALGIYYFSDIIADLLHKIY